MFFLPKLPPTFMVNADPHTGQHTVYRHRASGGYGEVAQFESDAEARAWIATEAKRKISYFDGEGRETKL
jgi:hypothetical protein